MAHVYLLVLHIFVGYCFNNQLCSSS